MSNSYNWDKGLLLTLPALPKIDVDYQTLLNAGDYPKIEDLLIGRLDGSPQDIPYYLPAYRAFIKKQEKSRAAALLGLHVESLLARKNVESEVFLLQCILGFWEDSPIVRDNLLRHLRAMYSDSPHFDLFVQYFKPAEATGVAEKLRKLELWLRYDEGRVVYMPSKGVARVREANLKLGVVRIVLKSGEQVSLRIDEAQRLTQPLSADHFLSRTMSDAGELSRIGSKDPGELLRLLFASIKRETSLVELKDMLSPVIPDAQWNPWWASIRKDPRLIVGSGTKPIINWNDSVSDGNTALMAKFLEASAYDKLEMFKKHAKRSETLAAGMIQALMGEATNASESDPSLALEIIFSLPESDTDDGTMPSGVSDLLGRGDTPKTIAGVKDKSIRKKAMQCALRSREDWPSIYRALFATETDNTLFKLLYDTLRSKGHDALLDEDVERAISDPSESPRFFLWLCKEMQDRSELLKRANWDFLRSLMNTLDHPAFKGHYPALRKLFDPGEIVDRVIETLDASTARSLLDALSRDRELEDYRKEDVRRKLFTHFPELQENKKQGWFVTKEGIEKKRLEFEKLVKEEIPHNTREIQRTREFGDLRENFEYHAARRRQEMLSSRAKTLHDELVTTRAIDPETVDTSKISIGTRVRLAPKDGAAAAVTLTILGPWDSDPATNILSYTSAAGAALLNAPKGSAVTFNDAGYLVEDIAVWTS